MKNKKRRGEIKKMKGYVVRGCVPFGDDLYDPVELKILPDKAGGVELSTDKFTICLDFDATQDLIESLTELLDELLKET